jgi:hypothetical protein
MLRRIFYSLSSVEPVIFGYQDLPGNLVCAATGYKWFTSTSLSLIKGAVTLIRHLLHAFAELVLVRLRTDSCLDWILTPKESKSSVHCIQNRQFFHYFCFVLHPGSSSSFKLSQTMEVNVVVARSWFFGLWDLFNLLKLNCYPIGNLQTFVNAGGGTTKDTAPWNALMNSLRQVVETVTLIFILVSLLT